MPEGARLLDIGSGDGDDSYFPLVRPLVARYVGVDPDPGGEEHAGLDEWHHMCVEQFAELAEAAERFDLALAVYVVEHVRNPLGFFKAARRCLRQGGSLFVVTPNLWHYFGLVAKLSSSLGIEDDLVRRLRRPHGHANQVAHFDVAYAANSVAALQRIAQPSGFSSLEIRHLENPEVFETYFPVRLRAFPEWYSTIVHRIGRPELFGTLICRFVASEPREAE